MSKIEWYLIGIINMAALAWLDRGQPLEHQTPFWRWHNSKQHDEWIGHVDGPNRHAHGWEGWMREWL